MEVLRALPLERLPGRPPSMLGLTVLRGQVARVHSLAVLLGEPASDPRLFVALQGGVVLAVDAIEGLAAVPLAPGDETFNGVRHGGEFLVTIDASRLATKARS